jgi:hypothetical protein
MITCDAVSVSLYRNTGVSLSRHAVTHDFAGALLSLAGQRHVGRRRMPP